MTSTTTTSTTYNTTTRHTLSRRKGPGFGLATASTPNLNQLYSSHSSVSSRLAPPSLSRKASFPALTQNSLASIPDDTEAYASSVLTNDKMPPPLTPGRPGAGDGLGIGDTVEVPGNMQGTVRFIGSVNGRKGTFVGVDLQPEFAQRGKNSGDVDGVFYFATSQPGAGIFLPLSKAQKKTSPASNNSPLSLTPNMQPGGLKVASQNSTNFTPPTPSLTKLGQSFSQSVGPGRAPSPMGKRPPRQSLPRPESPVRRLQLGTPRPSIATPGPKVPTRYGSPTTHKFAQSVRGTAGDPSKLGPSRQRKASIGPRSASALGNITSSNTPSSLTDDETTPVGVQRTKTNGSIGSVSSFSQKTRPTSRAASRADNVGHFRPASRATNNANDEEVERLKAELEDRNRQLREQASALAEMESNLSELSGLIDNQDALQLQQGRGGSDEDKDAASLRALLREKNDKIAMLTAEFDAHRADFRSTIDTLEMASTETERVYEKRIEELTQEVHELQDRTADVDNVASQLKQLEELVQELEEGLEDARRGEAEARGEVEFLRGEVERTRSELRREREKAQAAINGSPNGNKNTASKDLEQKEDEIRGLKAIIHSLSRDSVPGSEDKKRAQSQSFEDRLAREKLERELADLRNILNTKSAREEELERELETLRRGSGNAGALNNRGSVMTVGSSNNQRSSLRDSRGTVVMSPRSPELSQHNVVARGGMRHSRGATLDTMPESDAYSTATENSTLWCEICETAGHDVLTCTKMFGPNADQNGTIPKEEEPAAAKTGRDVVREGLKSLTIPNMNDESIKPAPLSPMKAKATPAPVVPPEVKILPNPMESGPVAGKESGVEDASKWCALCERDGHDSVDCPFEDAF
ncbi:hypothetical protein GE09DRAFT_1140815 [Coniochaeta sp. 2T2.1]|nr:hypothetical protein GE09DRAFT_1140815 [Coniochaeta sp. 2T2.1]